jgi:hypothetical protein
MLVRSAAQGIIAAGTYRKHHAPLENLETFLIKVHLALPARTNATQVGTESRAKPMLEKHVKNVRLEKYVLTSLISSLVPWEDTATK